MSRAPSHRGPRRSRAGLGLIEVTISSVLAFVVIAAAFRLGARSTAAYGTMTDEARLDARLSRAVSRCASKLRGAREDTLAVDASAGACVLDYEVALDYDDLVGAVSWRLDRLAFEDEPGEPEDGFDNDGDGLVDEGRLVYVRDALSADAIRTTLAVDVARAGAGETPGNGVDDDGDGLVDEPGFNLEHAGGALRAELVIQGLVGDGALVTRTITRTMGPRN